VQDVLVMEGPDGKSVKGRVNQVLTFQGLDRMQTTEAGPGDIVLINGIEHIGIGVTVTDPPTRRRCPCSRWTSPR
jgi:GTP-binding protein